MANSTFKPSYCLLLALFTPSLPYTPTPSLPHSIPLEYQSVFLSERASPNHRRPRRRLGGRDSGYVCAISPGLLEWEHNLVWSDRPLFVWNAPPEVTMQRLEVVDHTERLVWEKSLAAADRTAQYEGQPLQPGQFYTWRLHWRVQNAQYSADYTFQLMEADQRNQITADLQSLTRQLQASGLSPEGIARQQIDYLLNQPEPLWSDALQTLYEIENPSTETTQEIQTWINTACGQEEN